jgi:hypothetical protein
MGIQSSLLVYGRYTEAVTVLPGTADYGEGQWIEWDWTNPGRRSAGSHGQIEV